MRSDVVSVATPKQTFRAAVQTVWIEPLRALGFVGSKAASARRVLRDEGLLQVLDLQWSRFNCDDEARVRVHAGAGPLGALDTDQKFHLDACPLTLTAEQFYGKADVFWYVFGDGSTGANQRMRRREFPNNWGQWRYDHADAVALRAVLSADFDQIYRPFFEHTATAAGYARGVATGRDALARELFAGEGPVDRTGITVLPPTG